MSDQSALTTIAISSLAHECVNELLQRIERMGKDLHSSLAHEREFYADNKAAEAEVERLKAQNESLCKSYCELKEDLEKKQFPYKEFLEGRDILIEKLKEEKEQLRSEALQLVNARDGEILEQSERITELKYKLIDMSQRRDLWEADAGRWRNKAGELEATLKERRKENEFLGERITDLTNALSSRTVPCEPFTEINFNVQSGIPNREDKQTIRYSTKNGYAARLMDSINNLLKSSDARRVIDFIEGMANLNLTMNKKNKS